jgi:hypothetical protein
MRTAFLLLLCLGQAAIATAVEDFPFTARIVHDKTPIRSGPSEDHYPTDLLHRGQQVEIYRHESGDWYAIRPPRGSFSWVPARHLQIHEDNLAEVMEQGAVSYIGSRLSDRRHAQQIHLRKGEMLEIVGEKVFRDPRSSSPETWYKVAPPSGEFRWVFGPDVSDRRAPPAADVAHGARENRPPAVQLAQHTGLITGSPSNTAITTGTQRMDLSLSLIVAGPVANWDFSDLRVRAEADLKQAETALGRGRARLVLGEIVRFEELQKEYLALTESAQPASQATEVQVALIPPAANPLEKIPSFDGVGRLTPVVSRRSGAPKFALTDVKGKVIMFVTPGLGVDLQPHLGKVVGVSGSRGFMPRLKKAHVSVSQVERLAPTALLASMPEQAASRK